MSNLPPLPEIESPPSEVTFSQCREDSAIESAVIERLASERKRPLRVLAVASGGCTVLSMLASPAIARLEAIDPNPAQIHLVSLRLQAMVRLSLADQLLFLGGRHEGSPEDRARLYDVIRGYLTPENRAYWDARPAEIAFGVNRVGRFEGLCRQLLPAFAERGLDPIARPAEALTDKTWPATFEAVFGRDRLAAALGPNAVAFATSPYAEHYAASFAKVMLRNAPRDNYFLHQALLDSYPPGEANMPPYLQANVQAAIMKQGLHRLRLHEGRLNPQIALLSGAGQFDMIQTGILTDWMPRDIIRRLFETAAAALAPGGALLVRRVNGDYDLADELSRVFKVDERLSKSLLERERGFIFREVVVAYK